MKGGTVSEEPLTAQSVALLVTLTVTTMGREPEEFSDHNLRLGDVTTAAMGVAAYMARP